MHLINFAWNSIILQLDIVLEEQGVGFFIYFNVPQHNSKVKERTTTLCVETSENSIFTQIILVVHFLAPLFTSFHLLPKNFYHKYSVSYSIAINLFCKFLLFALLFYILMLILLTMVGIVLFCCFTKKNKNNLYVEMEKGHLALA